MRLREIIEVEMKKEVMVSQGWNSIEQKHLFRLEWKASVRQTQAKDWMRSELDEAGEEEEK